MSSVELARWLAESGRPFEIVKDRGFLSLMKTGRLGYWIPSPSTVARDAKTQTVTLQMAAGTADGGSHNLIQPPANAPECTRTQIEAMNNISCVLFKYAMVAPMEKRTHAWSTLLDRIRGMAVQARLEQQDVQVAVDWIHAQNIVSYPSGLLLLSPIPATVPRPCPQSYHAVTITQYSHGI